MNTEQELAELKNKLSLMEHERFDDDEIDLRELFNTLWQAKLKIIVITSLFAIASILYALSLPNIYKSTIKLVPTSQEESGGLSGLASQYGGLAAMAGINLGGGGDNSIDHAVELMSSWPYIQSFINKHDLKPIIMATKGWDKTTNQLIYDEELYDTETKTWLMEDDETLEPTEYKTYEYVIKKIFSVSLDDDLGILSISASHYSPDIAYQLTQLLTKDINEYFRAEDQKEARRSIEFIENKIKQTSNAQMIEIFYSMVEKHSQTLMLSEVNEQYLVKTLVPAMVAEQKDKPKRALIVVLATLLGGMLSIIIILIHSFSNKPKSL